MTTQLEDLKDLIGEVSISKDDEPEITVLGGGKYATVYHNIYHCSLSGSIVDKKDVFNVREGYALNEHTVMNQPHYAFKLKTVAYIMVADSFGYGRVPFVFNVRDMRKHYIYMATMLCGVLPKELVDIIMSYLGCAKPKNEYTLKDFPFNFEREYKGQLPSIVSREQLKMLYELGVIKIAIPLKYNNIFTTLTDKSFDYVYPNNAPNLLSQRFNTKEAMNTYTQQILKALTLI